VDRRSFLLGGIAACSAGSVAAASDPARTRRLLHRVGLLDGPDAEIPDVDVAVTDRGDHAVAELGREATLLCLHGRNGDHRVAFDDIGVHRFAAAAGLPWTVLATDGGASSYWHRRADGRDPLADALRLADPDLPVVVLGWSMGGFGALLAARDERVVAVAASSPAVWQRFDDAADGAFDDEADFDAHDVFVAVGARVRVDCGNADPFLAAARAVPADERWFGAGFHDAAYWRSQVAAQLEFLAG
jgi:pimeloyl-ACP methyl ester carboxylesterase